MSNPRATALVVILSAAALAVGTIVGLSLYADSDGARLSLLSRYFKALASGDEAAAAGLVSDSFESDLPLAGLRPGDYELFDFGEESTGGETGRFLVVLPREGGGKRAVLADVSYARRLLGAEIASMRLVDEGVSLDD